MPMTGIVVAGIYTMICLSFLYFGLDCKEKTCKKRTLRIVLLTLFVIVLYFVFCYLFIKGGIIIDSYKQI